MGKPGKLFTSLVNGVKAFKSPSMREKSTTDENSSAKKERDSSKGGKQRCMWTLGKSSSRNRGSTVSEPQPQAFEVKDVQVQQFAQGFEPPAPSFDYTEALLEEITSATPEEIVKAEPLSDAPYQEDWATILRLSDESEPEEYLGYTTHVSGLEEQAAVMIQAAFRRYLAQQHLKRALRVVIRLQAVARGRMIRKQAATTLRCIHALVKFQAHARGWLVRTSELGQRVQQHLEEIRLREGGSLYTSQVEEFEGRQQEKLKHLKSFDCALDEQLCMHSPKQKLGVMEFKPDEEYWGWTWLDRWMAARPWEKSTSPVAKEQSKSSAKASKIESKKVVEEGAENFVSILEEGNASTSSLRTESYNASANMEKVPVPPPTPPLPSIVTYPIAKQEVLCATKSHETAMIQTTWIAPFTTQLASRATIDSAPSLNETCSDLSPSLVSELVSSTVSHAAEPAEIMSLSTPADLEGLEAEAVTLSSSQSSPAPSAFLQQSESFSSPMSTTKEEGHEWQERTPAPLHIGDPEMADATADVIDSAEPGMKNTSVLVGALSSPNEEKSDIGTAPEMSKPDDLPGKCGAGMSASSTSSIEAWNMVNADVNDAEGDFVDNSTVMREHGGTEESVKNNKAGIADNSNGMRESHEQSEKNGLCTSSASLTFSEASVKQMSSILVKHEQRDIVSQSIPSYMTTTKSSKAKTRSHASPKQMPESPKQRLASPKRKLDSSASKKMPGSEGKGSFASPRQIVHVRTGSKGLSASLNGSMDRSSRSLGDSKRHAK